VIRTRAGVLLIERSDRSMAVGAVSGCCLGKRRLPSPCVALRRTLGDPRAIPCFRRVFFVGICDPVKSTGCLYPVPSPMTLACNDW
jgi:hypothetical protein